MFVILTLNCLQVTYYFYTRVVTLLLLTFTVNVCCIIINMLSFFCTCDLDSSLEVSDKLLHFRYEYNLTFSCFLSTYYLKLKILSCLSSLSLVIKEYLLCHKNIQPNQCFSNLHEVFPFFCQKYSKHDVHI